MSWEALNWADDQQCRSSPAKFVLYMLANRADEAFTCYPSVDDIAKKTQLGKSTVRRAITNLVEDGQIRVLQRWGRRGSRRSNRYQLLVLGDATALPESGDWKYEYQPQKKKADDGHETPGGVAQVIPLPASTTSEQGDQTARSEHLAPSEQYKPLAPSSTNRSLRAPSYKEESSGVEPPERTTPQPPEVIVSPSSTAQPEEEGDVPEGADLVADAAAHLTSLRPDWRRRDIVEVITAAEAQGLGTLPHVITALVDLAEGRHGHTGSPRRLLYAQGEWWRQPAPAADDRPAGPPCPVSWHFTEPADGCRKCTVEAKVEARARPDEESPNDPEAMFEKGAQYLPSRARNRLSPRRLTVVRS